MLPAAATDLFKANREMLLELMKKHGIRLLTETKVNRVVPGEAVAMTPHGEHRFPWDLLVLAVGSRSVNNLSEIALKLVKDVYTIGDSLSPRKIKDAVWEAFKQARLV
jgi:NADPH-dependent 2,4-dienoyl-CoA reductase/sulfur reductase-like enzyme